MQQMNIALIGCGRIGFLLENDPLRYKPCTHFGGALSAGLKINYACDINSSRLMKFSQKASISKDRLFSDYKELLNNVKLHMAIISTWTESHGEIAAACAKKGVKVIILEKPITHNLTAAEKLIRLCSKNNVKIIVSHERRYDSRYIKTKEIVTGGKLGNIKTVYASMLTGSYRGDSPIGEGGGPLLHDGTHIIDILRFFLGDMASVRGEFQRFNRKSGYEDRAAGWIKTVSDIDIFLEAGGGREYFVFELIISGTKGKIVIGNGYEKIFFNRKSKLYTGFKDLEQRPFPVFKKGNCFRNMYREARNLLTGKSQKITSSGIDGYRSLETIHALYYSSYRKGEKIDIPVKPELINIKEIFDL